MNPTFQIRPARKKRGVMDFVLGIVFAFCCLLALVLIFISYSASADSPRNYLGSTWVCEETGLSFTVVDDGTYIDCYGICTVDGKEVPFRLGKSRTMLAIQSRNESTDYLVCFSSCRNGVLRLYDIEVDELYHFAYEELHFVMQEAEDERLSAFVLRRGGTAFSRAAPSPRSPASRARPCPPLPAFA